jgi:virginiamycin B lyase
MVERFCFAMMRSLPGGVFLLCSAQMGLPVLRAATIPGTGSLSGTVEASKPFKAAQVYAKNIDKNMLYMVYTAGGRYRAVNMFPGNYEVYVKARGMSADAKKIVIHAGAQEVLNLTMQDAPPVPLSATLTTGLGVSLALVPLSRLGPDVSLASLDEMYPPGPGKDLVQPCLACHGPNFLAVKQWSDTQWNGAIDSMIKGPSALNGPQMAPMNPADRQTLVGYLTKNFGPGSTKKALKVDTEFPVDEQALSRAMYVEYYLPLDPKLDAGKKKREFEMVLFDVDGNVWYVDRSVPNRLGRMDPRTGESKDYPLPDPKADVHDFALDKQGELWWAEYRGFQLGHLDPKTGAMTRYDMDDTGGKLRAQDAGGLGVVLDSKQNVWFSVVDGNRLGKWDRATQKIKLWEPPTSNSFPYGIVVDKSDNIWISEFHGCKIAKFDPMREKWTEYPALTQPCTIRRLGLDNKGIIWYGVFNSGKLGKLDPATGKMVEYKIPMTNSMPHDSYPDTKGNVWIPDHGQGGTLIKFDTKTEKFTYYPSPQLTDMPKLTTSREGAVWYTPRTSEHGGAVGVLYPDVNKMTTLGAYY